MDFLPYAVTTDTGDTFDIEFPLSAHTEEEQRPRLSALLPWRAAA